MGIKPTAWPVAALTLILVSACGGSGSPPAGTSQAANQGSSAPSPASSLGTCTIYAQQHDAQIVVSPGDLSECNELIKDFAGGLAFWSYTPNGASVISLVQACDVTSPDGNYEAVVLDDSGGIIGQEVCSDFTGSSWTVSPSPGPLARQIAQQQSQAQQAQASASAAAATQQQVSQAQQSLASDVNTLASDASSLDNDNSLAGDISSMKQDYANEQSDFKTEQSDSCDSMGGDADTVGGDADTVGGDLDTLNGSITDLQAGGIQSVKNDLASVNTDLGVLRSLGASPDTESAAAIAAGNKALKDAANAISWAQGQGNTIYGEAQQLATSAQNYASSHCGG
jgi:hypothetical protein